MMRFASPEYFIYLWIIPVYLFLEWVFYRRLQTRLQKAFNNKILPLLTASVSQRKFKLKVLLRALVISFLVLALARPQMGESKQEIKSQGVELMLLIDVSDSMMAEDIRPNRLEQAKSELSKLVDAMPGNKVGVIAFAGSASLLSPLSTDPNAIKLYLESLTPFSVSSQGTEFKAALAEAKEAFNRGGVGGDESVKVTRVILLASDGEDHEPGALELAKDLAKEGIRIFSLAYGTEKGAPIPERDSMGFLRGYKKDQTGQAVMTTVKGDALRVLAQTGQGGFYHATFGGTHIGKLVEDIERLEKAEFNSEIATQYDEKFQYFLALAFILLLLEWLLTERKKVDFVWRGRFEK